ncbi:PLP-dependent aminotransferase family protein [Isoptericola sp. b490]|uniref:MocR-like transcription factor YczR n=1 Tax=Actinotalea lenta TaxID=3064654 RepID=UPI002713DAC2|nr:PLP-dependent aminotransferase family protein [Isoptericola sp. b490]MDO8120357.1 PLP-dependent aminotransferase family protein [Isoptericola sp. b490]
MSTSDRRIAGPALARLVGRVPTGVPAYLGLSDAVTRAVTDGALPVGTRVPSERELAGALGLSRTTISAAYQQLRERGLLRTRQGSGSVTTLPDAGPGATLLPSDDAGPVDLATAAPAAPPALVGAARRAMDRLPHHIGGGGYAQLGLPELRAHLADRYTARGIPTTADQILVTSGAQGATSLLAAALVGPGDRVAVENPAYPHTLAAIRAAGARPVPVPVHHAGLDLELLEATVRRAAPGLVHITPDHHNPTGTSLDPEARERLRRIATRHRTPVIGDETLSDLTLEGPPLEPFLGRDPDEHLVAVGSASKSFWGGLRLGWIRAHRDLILRLGQARVHRDLGAPVLDQLVLVELLADADALLAERRAELRTRRDALVEAIERALPWQVAVPAGGLSVWVDLGAPLSSALAAVAPRHGVRVTPGSAFGVDGGFETRLRLPFAAPAEHLVRGVTALASAWATLGPRAAAQTETIPV